MNVVDDMRNVAKIFKSHGMLDSAREADKTADEVAAIEDRLAVYKEYYEADQNWRKASAIGSNNENYLQAAERLKAAREAVRKLWGE